MNSAGFGPPFSLAEQVVQVESILHAEAERKGQTPLIRTHRIAHEFLMGSEVRLRQILINLLSNAVKYTQEGGQIQLDFYEHPSRSPAGVLLGLRHLRPDSRGIKGHEGRRMDPPVPSSFRTWPAPFLKPATKPKGKKGKEVSTLKGLSFLCAEDNDLNAEILKVFLEMRGAKCGVYPNGKALLDAFEDSKPGDYDALF